MARRPRHAFEGYKVKTLEHGGEYPDTMPQAIEVSDSEGRKALYVPLLRDGKVVRSTGIVDALKSVMGMIVSPEPELDDGSARGKIDDREEAGALLPLACSRIR
jgi:hypothetical protein